MQNYLAGMQEQELEDILCGLLGWEPRHSLASIYCALHPDRKQVLIRHIMQRLSYSSIAVAFRDAPEASTPRFGCQTNDSQVCFNSRKTDGRPWTDRVHR